MNNNKYRRLFFCRWNSLTPSLPHIDKASACHTERIKIKRKGGEVAIVTIAGRGMGTWRHSYDSHNKPGYLRYYCYMDTSIQKNLPFVQCSKNSIRRRGAVYVSLCKRNKGGLCVCIYCLCHDIKGPARSRHKVDQIDALYTIQRAARPKSADKQRRRER